MQARAVLSTAWGVALDLLYPPRCGGCDRRGTLFCGDCLLAMTPPVADGRTPDGVAALICAGAFAGPLRTAIHNLKYESDTPLVKPLARFLYGTLIMDERWDDLERNPPVIMPVPLHKKRQQARGFNQSALIARELARLTGWPIGAGLRRVKNTRSQVGLGVEERRENVQDAFAWEGGGGPPERVLLVDDVCTTGATLSECALLLRWEGVQQVYAATVAKAAGPIPSSDL